jgi:hypothetical protein
LQTVLNGCLSHSPITSEEANKAASIEEPNSSKYKKEETRRVESVIRSSKSKVTLQTSPSPSRPKKETATGVRKETPIPLLRRLVPTATRTPVTTLDGSRPKKIKTEYTADSDDELHDVKPLVAPKRRKSVSKASKISEEDMISQRISSIKNTSESKIYELVLEDENEEEDPLAQAVNSIRKSSSMLQNLFSSNQNTTSASTGTKSGEKANSSGKGSRARSVPVATVQPLMFNEEGVASAPEDWESTTGKIRSTAGGDDDSEAQESTSFPKSQVISNG